MTSEEIQSIKSYINGNTSLAATLNERIVSHGGFSIPDRPLIGIGSPNGNEDFSLSIDPKNITNFKPSDIIKVKNTRISMFPDFIMDWWSRQSEEIFKKLTSLPTLYITLPDTK